MQHEHKHTHALTEMEIGREREKLAEIDIDKPRQVSRNDRNRWIENGSESDSAMLLRAITAESESDNESDSE